jgi:hypothetical protein
MKGVQILDPTPIANARVALILPQNSRDFGDPAQIMRSIETVCKGKIFNLRKKNQLEENFNPIIYL